MKAVIKKTNSFNGLKSGDVVEVVEKQQGKLLVKVSKSMARRKDFVLAYGANSKNMLATVSCDSIKLIADSFLDFTKDCQVIFGRLFSIAGYAVIVDGDYINIDVTYKS